MTDRRLVAVAAFLTLVLAFVPVGDVVPRSIVVTVVAAAVGVLTTGAYRRRRATRAELVTTWIVVVVLSAGAVYLEHWSGEADIGGVVPFLLGLLGMLYLAIAMSVDDHGRLRR